MTLHSHLVASWAFCILLTTAVCIVLVSFTNVSFTNVSLTNTIPNSTLTNSEAYRKGTVICPDVLRLMTSGSWTKKVMTVSDREEMNRFLLYALKMRGGLERSDGKCGNVTITANMTMTRSPQAFRAVCDPWGARPCCFHGNCLNKTEAECKCQDCFDIRQRVFAEWATWRPDDERDYKPRCAMREFGVDTACGLLDGGQIYFVGDSLIRHLFLATVRILQGDNMYGGLQQHLPKDIKEACKGRYAYPAKLCKPYIDYTPNVCGGKVKLVFKECPQFELKCTEDVARTVRALRHTTRSLFLYGVGMWSRLNSTQSGLYAKLLIDAADYSNKTHDKFNHQWPRLLWHSVHAFTPLKNPLGLRMTNTGVEQHNNETEELLRAYDVPVLNSYNMTQPLLSPDGTHYGPGANQVKAQILLNYIEELIRNGYW